MSKVKLNVVNVSGFIIGGYLSDKMISLSLSIDKSYLKKDANGNTTGEWVQNQAYVNAKSFNPNKFDKYKELIGSEVIIEGSIDNNPYKKADGTNVNETYILISRIHVVNTNEDYKANHTIKVANSNGEPGTNVQGENFLDDIDV